MSFLKLESSNIWKDIRAGLPKNDKIFMHVAVIQRCQIQIFTKITQIFHYFFTSSIWSWHFQYPLQPPLVQRTPYFPLNEILATNELTPCNSK